MILYLLCVKHHKEVNFNFLTLNYKLFLFTLVLSLVKLKRVKENLKKKKKNLLMDFMRCIRVDCDFYIVE